MRSLTKTTLGAAIGSLVVLLLHPVSRPFALGGVTQYGPSQTLQSSPFLTETFSVLPQPKTVLEASLWMQEGAKRIYSREPFSQRNVDALILVAASAAEEEPQNAFWPQMGAVFLAHSGRNEEAAKLWESAARCERWNDFQSIRFATAKEQLQAEMRSNLAWFNAAYYYRRSSACAMAINRFGRESLSKVGLSSVGDLERRMTTLRNGVLVRDNSRSVELGLYGVDLIEASATSARIAGFTPRKLIIARFGFIDQLRANQLAQDVGVANSAFLDNDAWHALLVNQNPAEAMREWSIASILQASSPGCLFVVALVGYGFAAFGSAVKNNPKLSFLIRSPIAPIFGLILSVLTYFATGFELFSLSIAACFAFLAMGPMKHRARPPESFGPLFDFAIGAIAFLFSMFVTMFLVGATTPAVEVAPLVNLPEEYFGGRTLPLGLAMIVVSLLFLISPLWAIAQKVSTTHVVAIAIRNFGFDIGVLCSFLGIVLVPVSIYLDSRLATNMSRALLNEPTFYLTR